MNRVLTVLVIIAAVTVVGCGGGGGGGGNRAPVINSLVAASPAIWPGAATNIACDADDADGDALSYTWTAVTGGTITPNDANAVFTAPVNGGGDYEVRCQVTDGRGGSDTGTVQVTVGATVTGRIVNTTTGAPVVGMEVMLDGRIGVTAANGDFTITGVGQGTHQLQEGPNEETYSIAGLIQVQVGTAGSTVQIAEDVEVFAGPPPPPF